MYSLAEISVLREGKSSKVGVGIMLNVQGGSGCVSIHGLSIIVLVLNEKDRRAAGGGEVGACRDVVYDGGSNGGVIAGSGRCWHRALAGVGGAIKGVRRQRRGLRANGHLDLLIDGVCRGGGVGMHDGGVYGAHVKPWSFAGER